MFGAVGLEDASDFNFDLTAAMTVQTDVGTLVRGVIESFWDLFAKDKIKEILNNEGKIPESQKGFFQNLRDEIAEKLPSGTGLNDFLDNLGMDDVLPAKSDFALLMTGEEYLADALTLGIPFFDEILQRIIGASSSLDTVQHNRLYVPEEAHHLQFDLFAPALWVPTSMVQVTFTTADGVFVAEPVKLQPQFFESRTYSVCIPPEVQGQIATFEIQVKDIEAEFNFVDEVASFLQFQLIFLDNVRFGEQLFKSLHTRASSTHENGFITLSGVFNLLNPNDATTALIDWGDGTSEEIFVDAGLPGFHVQHHYDDDAPTATPQDVYTILGRLNGNPCEIRTATATVENVPPQNIDAVLDDSQFEEFQMVELRDIEFSDVGPRDSFEVEVAWGDGQSDGFSMGPDQIGPDGTFLPPPFAHTYAAGGPDQYTVTLTVTDDDTGLNGLQFFVAGVDVPPTLFAAQSFTTNEGDELTIPDIGHFSDPDFGPDEEWTFEIDWDDGTIDSDLATIDVSGSAVQPSLGSFDGTHTYEDGDDFFTVTLTVTDSDGLSASASMQIDVLNVDPTLTLGSIPQVNEGLLTVFTDLGTFSDPGFGAGESWFYDIDWGDGTTPDSGPAMLDIPGAPNSPSQGSFDGSHIYANDGTYTVTVTLTDDDGGQDVQTTMITVTNVDPTLMIAFTLPTFPYEEGKNRAFPPGTIFNFEDPAFNRFGSAPIENYEFDVNWGDGFSNVGLPIGPINNGSEQVPTRGSDSGSGHLWRDNGTYTVQVTLKDGDGGIAIHLPNITVSNVAPEITLVSPSLLITPGTTASFLVELMDQGPDDDMTMNVDWGDGTTTTHPLAAGSTMLNVGHQYPNNDTFLVRFDLVDKDGDQASPVFRSVTVGTSPSNPRGIVFPNPNPPLMAPWGLLPDSDQPTSITSHQIAPVLAQAITNWSSAGLSQNSLEQLKHVSVSIVDAAANFLAWAVPDDAMILLDRDAARLGWFVDESPADAVEFGSETFRDQWLATSDSPAFNRIDLLTVLTHELGHIVGMSDQDPQTSGAGIAAATLPPGTRRLPNAIDVANLRQDNVAPVIAPLHTVAVIDGWWVRGTATVGENAITLGEDDRFFSGVSRTFTVPKTDKILQFFLEADLFATPDSPPDAFEVAILDAATGQPVAGVANGLTQTDALLNLQATGELFFGADTTQSLVANSGDIATLDGPAVVTVDLTGVPAGKSVTLYFDLLGFGAVDSSVTIDNVRLLPVDGAEVVGRHLFYNNSYFDGRDVRASEGDDLAIAPDKQPLMPGGTASFANYTGYYRGVNGIMIDVRNLIRPDEISADDFEFHVGNDDNPDAWPLAPAPTEVIVHVGAGDEDSDRITITWPDKAIEKQWLQVIVKANDNTGLQTPDIFYWGNAVGDTGDSPDSTFVDGTDLVGVRDNPRHFLNPAPLDDPLRLEP